jgi:hypothetical protein
MKGECKRHEEAKDTALSSRFTGLVNLAERARQEVVETLRKDARETAWDTIVGAVESGDDVRTHAI